MCRGSVSVTRDVRGGTEVSVKITCDEERRWSQIGSYVAIIKEILISEIRRRRGKGREERGGKG